MNVVAIWLSGSITSWSTTILTSGNGEGISASEEFLDLSDPYRLGIILIRRYFSFEKAAIRSFSDDADEDQKVLIKPDEIENLLTLTVDGKMALAKVIYDEEGKPQVSMHGELTNLLMPDEPTDPPEDDGLGLDDSLFDDE